MNMKGRLNSFKRYNNGYIRHRLFFITVILNTIFSHAIFTFILRGNPIISKINNIVQQRYTPVFLSLLYGINIYEVCAHIFAALKYIGYPVVIFFGTENKQSAYEFVIATSIDITGWILIAIYYGYFHYISAYIISFHISSAIIATIFKHTFQSYYIADLEEKRCTDDNTDNFNYTWWNLFRIFFVIVDGLARMFLIIYTK